jgi:hypothetical protein
MKTVFLRFCLQLLQKAITFEMGTLAPAED